MFVFISQRVGTFLIIAIVVALNLYLMGEHGGRSGDYIEQQDYSERYIDDNPAAAPMSIDELEAALKLLISPTPTPTPTPSSLQEHKP